MNIDAQRARTTVKGSVSDREWQARVELAAAYRIAHHYKWSSLIYNHIALRVPGEPDAFLFKAHTMMFQEVRASNLLKLRLDGKQLTEADGVQAAGFAIHAAVLKARPEITCTIHIHSIAGAAMAAHGKGLLPINQASMRFYNRLSYHEYSGIADTPEVCEHLAQDLGQTNRAMILKNHGLLTAGRSVSEALITMNALVTACEIQLQLEASGAPIDLPPPDICELTARQLDEYGPLNEDADLSAYLRLAAQIDPSYVD